MITGGTPCQLCTRTVEVPQIEYVDKVLTRRPCSTVSVLGSFWHQTSSALSKDPEFSMEFNGYTRIYYAIVYTCIYMCGTSECSFDGPGAWLQKVYTLLHSQTFWHHVQKNHKWSIVPMKEIPKNSLILSDPHVNPLPNHPYIHVAKTIIWAIPQSSPFL